MASEAAPEQKVPDNVTVTLDEPEFIVIITGPHQAGPHPLPGDRVEFEFQRNGADGKFVCSLFDEDEEDEEHPGAPEALLSQDEKFASYPLKEKILRQVRPHTTYKITFRCRNDSPLADMECADQGMFASLDFPLEAREFTCTLQIGAVYNENAQIGNARFKEKLGLLDQPFSILPLLSATMGSYKSMRNVEKHLESVGHKKPFLVTARTIGSLDLPGIITSNISKDVLRFGDSKENIAACCNYWGPDNKGKIPKGNWNAQELEKYLEGAMRSDMESVLRNLETICAGGGCDQMRDIHRTMSVECSNIENFTLERVENLLSIEHATLDKIGGGARDKIDTSSGFNFLRTLLEQLANVETEDENKKFCVKRIAWPMFLHFDLNKLPYPDGLMTKEKHDFFQFCTVFESLVNKAGGAAQQVLMGGDRMPRKQRILPPDRGVQHGTGVLDAYTTLLMCAETCGARVPGFVLQDGMMLLRTGFDRKKLGKSTDKYTGPMAAQKGMQVFNSNLTLRFPDNCKYTDVTMYTHNGWARFSGGMWHPYGAWVLGNMDAARDDGKTWWKLFAAIHSGSYELTTSGFIKILKALGDGQGGPAKIADLLAECMVGWKLYMTCKGGDEWVPFLELLEAAKQAGGELPVPDPLTWRAVKAHWRSMFEVTNEQGLGADWQSDIAVQKMIRAGVYTEEEFISGAIKMRGNGVVEAANGLPVKPVYREAETIMTEDAAYAGAYAVLNQDKVEHITGIKGAYFEQRTWFGDGNVHTYRFPKNL